MRITAKGQVTIPQAIRQQAGMLPHTEVEFAIEQGVVRLIKKKGTTSRSRGAAVVRRLQGLGDVAMTTDEIMALTRATPDSSQNSETDA